MINDVEIGKKIKEARQQMGLTQSELGKKLNVSLSSIQKYEAGKIINMKTSTIENISKVLEISTAYLMGWEEPEMLDNAEHRKGVQIPVYGNIAAGIPIEAVENIIDYEEITQELAATGEFMALQVQGDSMEPRISTGDIVIIRKQSDVDSGQLAAVLINGDNATLKKVIKTNSGISLISFNPSYSPMNFSNKQITEMPVTIIGRVVELRAKF